jgi:large subunit ribosomal protein L10
MAITKGKKKDILEKLKGVTDKNSVVFLNFHGLPVNETAEVRRKLRESGVSYFVAKKSLVKKAFGDTSITGEIPQLDGELALAYADDLIAPAREVFSFQKKYADKVSILGGVFEKAYFSKVQMEEIAKIPSQDTLRGMFVNVINSPIQGLVLALNAIAEKKQA